MSKLTEQAIKASLLKLLEERPLSRITVKDIVEDCGINRNSFYYHFADIPTLLEQIITDEAEKIIAEHPAVETLEQCMEAAISFALNYKRAVLHIYNSTNRDFYEQSLMRICGHVVTDYFDLLAQDISVDPKDREVLIRFYKCECFGQIIDWMNNGMKPEAREQFRRLCELRQGIAFETLRKNLQQK